MITTTTSNNYCYNNNNTPTPEGLITGDHTAKQTRIIDGNCLQYMHACTHMQTARTKPRHEVGIVTYIILSACIRMPSASKQSKHGDDNIEPLTIQAASIQTLSLDQSTNYYYEELGTIPVVTMAQSAANWRNKHTGSHAFTHTLTSTQLVTTKWCEAPAQLLVFSACWVFSRVRNPPNSDMDYRIFNLGT